MVMQEQEFSRPNLAGILSEALGLESGTGRGEFSGTSRSALRKALEHPTSPKTFPELCSTLAVLSSDGETVKAVRRLAQEEPERTLQQFARDYIARG